MDTIGPEGPTLMEKFLGLFHLPYVVICLILGALLGPVGQFLATYTETSDFGESFRRTVLVAFGTNNQLSIEAGVAASVGYALVIFYLLYGTRYMRTRVASSESKLSELTPLEKETFRKSFGGISRNRGPLAIAVIYSIIFVPYYASTSLQSSGLFLISYGISSNIITGIVVGTFIWVYGRSLWGLHMFGKENLQLKSFYEDRTMGLRPMGSLALSLAFAFFVLCGLGMLLIFISPDLVSLVTVAVMTAFGGFMFVLTLNGIHRKMQMEKQLSQLKVRKDFIKLVDQPDSERAHDSGATMIEVRKLLSHQLMEQKASSIASWPFDTGIVGRFTAIVLSVTAILLSTLIRQLLHF